MLAVSGVAVMRHTNTHHAACASPRYELSSWLGTRPGHRGTSRACAGISDASGCHNQHDHTHRHELSLPLPLRAVNVHILLVLLLGLVLANAEVHPLIVLLAFLFGARADMRCCLSPIAQAVENKPGDEQQLLIRAPVRREYGLRMLFLP